MLFDPPEHPTSVPKPIPTGGILEGKFNPESFVHPLCSQ
jgi:hypothetical protein